MPHLQQGFELRNITHVFTTDICSGWGADETIAQHGSIISIAWRAAYRPCNPASKLPSRAGMCVSDLKYEK